jgi:hypothetical protein
LACKPDSVIWAFVPFSCVGGVVTVQVRELVVLANESRYQLYCGRLPVPRRHHTEVRFTRTSAVTARRGLTECRAPESDFVTDDGVGLLVADPRMVRDLHSQGVPHLAVRVRDGTGLVEPLVIPGVTSCLSNH